MNNTNVLGEIEKVKVSCPHCTGSFEVSMRKRENINVNCHHCGEPLQIFNGEYNLAVRYEGDSYDMGLNSYDPTERDYQEYLDKQEDDRLFYEGYYDHYDDFDFYDDSFLYDDDDFYSPDEEDTCMSFFE